VCVKRLHFLVFRMQESGWLGFNSSFVLMKALCWSLTSLGLASLRCRMGTLSVPCLFAFSCLLWMGRHFAMNMMVGSGQLRWWWHNDKEDKTRFPQTCSPANPRLESPFYDKRDKVQGRFWSMPRSFQLLVRQLHETINMAAASEVEENSQTPIMP